MVVHNNIERVYVYVEDFDNYLSQIFELEGLPSTALIDEGKNRYGSELVAMAVQFIAIQTI